LVISASFISEGNGKGTPLANARLAYPAKKGAPTQVTAGKPALSVNATFVP
jgi:hypothetical protein